MGESISDPPRSCTDATRDYLPHTSKILMSFSDNRLVEHGGDFVAVHNLCSDCLERREEQRIVGVRQHFWQVAHRRVCIYTENEQRRLLIRLAFTKYWFLAYQIEALVEVYRKR